MTASSADPGAGRRTPLVVVAAVGITVLVIILVLLAVRSDGDGTIPDSASSDPGRGATATGSGSAESTQAPAPGSSDPVTPGSGPASAGTPRATEPGSVPPGAAPTTPAERPLLCELTATRIRALRGDGGTAADPAAGLRDGVSLLNERLAEWQSGSEGVAGAEAALAIVQDIVSAWNEALSDFDSGDEGAGQEALIRADERLDDLDDQLVEAPIAGCG